MFPLSNTIILSLYFTSDTLFEIIIQVFSEDNSLIFSINFSDVLLSNAEKGSSKINILLSFKNALEIDTLCFCPPDKSPPLSPITVSIPFGIFFISSYTIAFLVLSLISSSSYSSLNKLIFSFNVDENKKLS